MAITIPAQRPTWEISAGDILHAKVSINKIINEANQSANFAGNGRGAASINSGRANTIHTSTKATSSSQYPNSRYSKKERPVIVIKDVGPGDKTVRILAIGSFGSDSIETVEASTTYWAVNLSPKTPLWPKDRPGVPKVLINQVDKWATPFDKNFSQQYVICYPVDIPIEDLDEWSSTLQYKLDPLSLPALRIWCSAIRVQPNKNSLNKPTLGKSGEFIYHSSASVMTEHVAHRSTPLTHISEDGDPTPTSPPSMNSTAHFPLLGTTTLQSPHPRGLPTPRNNNNIARLFNSKKIPSIFRRDSSQYQQNNTTIASNIADVAGPIQGRIKHRAATIAF